MAIFHVSESESGARARPPGIPMPAFRICTEVPRPAKDPVRRRAHRTGRGPPRGARRTTRARRVRPDLPTHPSSPTRCGCRRRPDAPPGRVGWGCASGTAAGVCAPPSRPRTPGAVPTDGTNGRCARSDAERRPCGRLRECGPSPAWRSAGAATLPADGAERAPALDLRGPLAQARGWRDARRALPGRRGLGGGSARLPPVTAPAGVAGADWCERGSDRRQKRPPGQWRQGVC